MSIALVRHVQASGRAAVVLALREPGMGVVHEREIRAAERAQGRVLASVAVGSLARSARGGTAQTCCWCRATATSCPQRLSSSCR